LTFASDERPGSPRPPFRNAMSTPHQVSPLVCGIGPELRFAGRPPLRGFQPQELA
jgi:hypothetical protein